jgi:DNA-binding CsgD family transcriptional regulator
MKPRRHQQVWTTQQDADLVARCNAGQSAERIARDLGRSVEGVKRRRQKVAAEIVGYTNRRSWTPQEDAQLIVMLTDSRTPREVARALGRSITSVHSRTDFLRARCAPLLPPTRLQVARDRALPPISKDNHCPFITAEDRAWMNYWRQPRVVRKGQAPSPPVGEGWGGGECRP